ncbi:MAG: hypothetical protein LLG93_08290, partial [Deltaproteobacteria bacterium]|nr:hypothetical protein [Deltaproteobacteria bacterium]
RRPSRWGCPTGPCIGGGVSAIRFSILSHAGDAEAWLAEEIELEFRYNNRHSHIFDRVASCLCDLLPKWD